MLTDYIGYARISASSRGLSIKFHDENIQPHVDSKSCIHVQRPDMMWDQPKWEQWYYFLEHEIGHECEPWYEWKRILKEKKVKMGSFFGYLRNLQSDHAQEHDRYGEFHGVDIALGEGRAKFVGGTLTLTSKDDESAKWNAVWKYDALKRAEWNPLMAVVADAMTIDSPAQAYLDKLLAWNKSAATCTDEEQVHEYTREMCTVLGVDPEEAGDGQAAEGEGTPGEGDGEEKEGEGGQSAGGSVDYEAFFEHKHESGQYSTSDLHINYNGWNGDGIYVPREVIEIDMKRGTNMDKLRDRGRDYSSIYGGDSFGKQVRKILQVKTQTRWQSGFKRGRINSRVLHRVSQGEDAVFKRKVSEITLNSAVSIGIDFSGSMGGKKTKHACHAAILLNEAVSSLGVPTEMWGFSDTGEVLHMLIKQFNEQVSEDTIKDRFSQCSSVMNSNADGQNVWHAALKLARRPEPNKVLIVLSDGSPASHSDYDDDGYLRRVTSMIEATPITLIGIGICDDNVKRYYRRRTVIHDASELESKLLEVVKTQLLEV